jgi:hypothetical protein
MICAYTKFLSLSVIALLLGNLETKNQVEHQIYRDSNAL